MKPALQKTPRIEVADALRGFAVMAIALLHNVEHFLYSAYPADSSSWLGVLDKGVLTASFALFGGKAYAIFALLFGLTFYIQSSNQARQGRDFGYRFLWRLCLLAVFASVNALFFPGGDVMMLFVVVGPVLFLVRRWSDKAILALAVFFLLQPIEWGYYIAHLVNPAFQIPDWGADVLYASLGETTRSGNFWDFLCANVTLGQKASLAWGLGAGRPLQTAGMFLLGVYMGRKELLFSTEKNLRFWLTVLVVCAVAFGPLYQLKDAVMAGDVLTQRTVGTAFDMWQKLAFTFVLVASFILLYQRESFRKLVSNLRFYGKMSLTNYVSQSLIGFVIYFPFALHLAPHCGYTVSLLIGCLMVAGQVMCSKWWLARHKQGPLESLWHKWTWLGRK